MYYAFDYKGGKPPIIVGGIEYPQGKVLEFFDIKKRNQYIKANKYIGVINRAYAELLKKYGINHEQIQE